MKKTKAKATEPKVVKGSHLTVTTYEDGSTKLEWDDAALLEEVRAAILKAETVIPVNASTAGEENVKVKKARKSK